MLELDSRAFLTGLFSVLAVFAVSVFVVVQVVTSTPRGLSSASGYSQRLTNGARYLVNLDRVPLADRPCYNTYVLAQGSYPSMPALQPLLAEAQRDRLSLFASGPYRMYRAEGPPHVAECEAPAGTSH